MGFCPGGVLPCIRKFIDLPSSRHDMYVVLLVHDWHWEIRVLPKDTKLQQAGENTSRKLFFINKLGLVFTNIHILRIVLFLKFFLNIVESWEIF